MTRRPSDDPTPAEQNHTALIEAVVELNIQRKRADPRALLDSMHDAWGRFGPEECSSPDRHAAAIKAAIDRAVARRRGGRSTEDPWRRSAFDWYFSLTPWGFLVARCPVPDRSGRPCGSPVYDLERDRSAEIVRRGANPVVVPIGHPDRTSPEGERWRTGRAIAGAAGVFRGVVHVYRAVFPWDRSAGRRPSRAGDLKEWAVRVDQAVEKTVGTLWEPIARRRRYRNACSDAGGVYRLALSSEGVVLLVFGNEPPDQFFRLVSRARLSGRPFSHVAMIPAPASDADLGAHFTRVLDVLDAQRSSCPDWLQIMLADSRDLRGKHLISPWGAARRRENRVRLISDAPHRAHLCPVGPLLHADGSELVEGTASGGRALAFSGGGETGSTPTEAVRRILDRWLDDLRGRLPPEDLDDFFSVHRGDLPEGFAESWEWSRDRPPPWDRRRERRRALAH